MDFDLSDEQRLVRETARAFTDDEIVARARENARAEHFDRELVGMLAAQGYLGAIVPPEYGGAGLDHVTYGLIVEEIGRGDSAMRTVVSVQTSLVCGSILRWGTDEQRARYLPKLCSGEWLGCFGLTEPDSGSDAASLRTRARRVDGGWLMSGAKMWISLGNHANVALDLRPDRSRAARTAAWPACSSTPSQPGFARRRSTTRWACTPPTRRRSRSTTSSSPTTTCSARSARASRSR